MAESTSKRLKPTDPEEATVVEDRISNLPDSLLCHVLSFLTTKEAVVTSILSSRWTTLWTLVPKLDFNSHQFEEIPYSDEEEQSPNHQGQWNNNRYHFTFAHIVSRVWALRDRGRNNANPIKHFRLYWHSDSDPIHVDTWVRTAITPDLEELDLFISHRKPFNFPSTLFYYAKSLLVLKLKGKIVLNPPPSSSSSGFPSLKTIHLVDVRFANDNTVSKLLSCCPVLQNLYLQIYIRDRDNYIKIIAPTLKTLHLIFLRYWEYKVEINAPALEYLYCRGCSIEDILLGNLSNLFEANVTVDHDPNKDYGKKIRDFIGALSNVKSLHLASNLTQEEVEWYNVDEEYTFIIETIFNEDVPICISSHLQTFHFKGFKGSTYELEFVRHILKTARFLKTMTVSSARMNSEEKVRVLKELLMFPRESRTCQIAFN
ncbi:FBD-associated F-box protein At3g52670-like isoform X2 [Quercus robur]|uniref:FBD-associated F-box protein At3g52670-like isoform X2 n=1 Tax=Quercus robur TaxID=38942 RepID=UPI002161A8B6|nr:FBD-associated F-box protein At3g52670-like isoform X2 [Quercus robur]